MRHPIVHALIALPLGILTVSPLFDLFCFTTGDLGWARLGFWVLTVGIVGGLVALGAEVWELRHEHPATRPFRLTLFEIGAFLTALLFYLTSWVIRVAERIVHIGGGELGCSAVGTVVLLIGGWLGGVLVDRWHIGLSEDPTAEAAARREERHHPPI